MKEEKPYLSLVNHPLASQGLKDSLKDLLPAQTGRERRIVARLTTAYENLGKNVLAARLRVELDDLYAESEALGLGLVFGTLDILVDLIDLKVDELASKQRSGTGKRLAPGLRGKFLGGRVNTYVNLKASSMTLREDYQFLRFADAWATLARFSPGLAYLRHLDQAFADAQKQARHLQFSLLEAAARLIESAVKGLPKA